MLIECLGICVVSLMHRSERRVSSYLYSSTACVLGWSLLATFSGLFPPQPPQKKGLGVEGLGNWGVGVFGERIGYGNYMMFRASNKKQNLVCVRFMLTMVRMRIYRHQNLLKGTVIGRR